MCDSLQPHGLQHARLPCSLPTPRACSNSCWLSRWCHPTISFSVIPFSSCLKSFQHQSLFQESAGRIRWPKYWSFSISPSNEYSGLISFRIDWFDFLPVQGTLKSLLQHSSWKHQFLGAQPSLWSNSHISTWLLANHSFDYRPLLDKWYVWFWICCLGLSQLFFQGTSIIF